MGYYMEILRKMLTHRANKYSLEESISEQNHRFKCYGLGMV